MNIMDILNVLCSICLAVCLWKEYKKNNRINGFCILFFIGIISNLIGLLT